MEIQMLNLNKGSPFFAFLGVDSHLSWNLKRYFHPVLNILKGILKEKERETINKYIISIQKYEL